MQGAAPMVADGGEAETVVDGREAAHDLVEDVCVELRPAPAAAVTWLDLGAPAAPPPTSGAEVHDLVGKALHW